MRKNNSFKKYRSLTGFTLIEVLTAAIIIGILATLTIPRFINAIEESMGSKALENLRAIANAETVFFNDATFGLDNQSYTANIATLQQRVTFSINDGNWAYTIVLLGNNGFTATATRSGDRFAGSTIVLRQEGKNPPTITITLVPGGVIDHYPYL